MAGVVDQDPTRVVIKREIEDPPESPEHNEAQESPSQADTNGSQKQSKVPWSDDEVRSMIQLHKSFGQRFKDGNYSKKQLLEDVTQEMNLIGFDATPDKVRNKMKYLRARYKGLLQYNAKHVEKKPIPFEEELTELFSMEYFDDQEPLVNGNGVTVNSICSKPSARVKRVIKKKSRTSPADLKTAVAKKRSYTVSKATKVIKKRVKGKPLFQCGRCLVKFQSSQEMHGHVCKTPVKLNNEAKKKTPPKSPPHAFHWNNLITMHFLDLLKEYQDSHKNSNFRKGNIWEVLSTHMKRLGHKIHPSELAKKWNVLSTNYEKTFAYNNTHKDKKKCAFYKRLMELHNHQTSFNCFKERNQAAKRTVQVSPFSFSQAASSSSSSSLPRQLNFNNLNMVKEEKRPSNMTDFIQWLDKTWTEYKEIERARQQLENQRHNEIMEMLAYLVESKDRH